MNKPIKQIAQEMLGDVRSGAPRAMVKLQRGLTMTLVGDKGTYMLTCGRRLVYPSSLELQIVANAFGLFNPQWEEYNAQDWRCYRYKWQWVSVAEMVEKVF